MYVYVHAPSFSVQNRLMDRLALFVYLVAVCVHSLPSCGATDYYVRPTQPASISCPGQPCLTFSQYANSLSSNATYHFMAGVHVIKGTIEVRNIRNVSLVALERNVDLPQIISECGSSGNTSNRYVECFGIMFKDVRDITISSLNLKMTYATTGLTFIDSTGIVIQTFCVSITEGTKSPEYDYSLLFSNTTDILMNSLAIAHGGIHVTHSIIVDVSNVSLDDGIMNFTQTIDVHISDITTCDPFDPFGIDLNETAYTSTAFSDVVVLESRDVIYLLNSINTTIENVTIHYTGKDGISVQNSSNTIIINITIGYTKEAGIHLQNTLNTIITSIIIHFTRGAGIEMIGSRESTVSNVHVINGDITMKYNRLEKINNLFLPNYGIYIKQSQDIEVNGSVILNSYTGIYIIAVNNSDISDCTIKHALYGIDMHDNYQIIVKKTQVLHTEICALRAYRIVHSKIMDIELINGSHTAVLQLYSVVDTVINSLSIVNWTLEAVFAQEVKNTSLLNVSLIITTTTTDIYTTTNFHGIVLYNCSNVTISNSIFTNIPSFDIPSNVAFQSSVVALYYSEENIIIRNCSFEANNITALTVVQSKVRISGKVNFTGNTAFRGAAITFTQGGKMIVSEDSHIIFKNNYARITGGAIYITTSYIKLRILPVFPILGITTECFIEVEGYTQHHLTFLNNRAGLGGNELYGGGLQYGCNRNCKRTPWLVAPQHTSDTCLAEFLAVSDIKNSTLSNISSDPSRVCLCVDKKPDCLNIFKTVQTNGHGPYPGQTIEISAVVVGQNFGTVSGAVYAQLINSPFNNNTTKLDRGQETQGVNHNSCNNLQYTIYSPVENITIMLALAKLKETDIVKEETFTETKKTYEKYENNQDTPFPQAILEFPVYINIPLQPCPPGFSITHKHPVTCDCVRQIEGATRSHM